MGDIINDFFRRNYPADHATNWQTRSLAGGYWREYQNRDGSHIFPTMVCADGFSMSVQGHFGAYSMPRDDFADEYSAVEIYCLSGPEPILTDWENTRRRNMGLDPIAHATEDGPLGYVPISVVLAVIAAHGGLATPPAASGAGG